MGARVIAMSDSTGYIHDPEGIDLAAVKEIKLGRRGRIREYLSFRPKAEYRDGHGTWSIPCDIALPCATQNELTYEDAKSLVHNGCFAVCEGANMPCTPEAVRVFQSAGILYAPGKAANAGGVAVSALEMVQNSMRLSWTFEDVDKRLKNIMTGICHRISSAAKEYGRENDLVAGANIAGFQKVADAMMAQGIV